MPQLDFIIFSTQTSFVFLFWLGYFVFLKTILPLVSMEMKVKQKRLLRSLLWFKSNLQKTLFFRLPFGKLLVKTRGVLNCIDYIFSRKQVFFGIYQPDLLFIKNKNKSKNN
jgi:hypothetical protein